jgi:hypothetical protein
MWAVADTDLDGLSIASGVSTAAIAVGSFLLGVVINIVINYGGSQTLTEKQSFMLHQCTWFCGAGAVLFYCFGAYLQHLKGSLWNKIKKESRQIAPQP